MKLTHFGHACVLVETDTARLLFDPGTFSEGFEELTDLDAVVLTHQHADHFDADRLPTVFAANPGVRFVIDPGSAESTEELADVRDQVVVARPGDRLDVAGTRLDIVGGTHATIHPDLETIPNVGYVVDDGAFFHPGDSFAAVPDGIDVLALPTGAPWLKLSDVVEFFRAVRPRHAVPIHEMVLRWPEMHYGRMEALAPDGAGFTVLERGTPTTV